jgi:hypothetical protein
MLKVIKFSSIFIVLSIFTACAGHKKAMEVCFKSIKKCYGRYFKKYR